MQHINYCSWQLCHKMKCQYTFGPFHLTYLHLHPLRITWHYRYILQQFSLTLDENGSLAFCTIFLWYICCTAHPVFTNPYNTNKCPIHSMNGTMLNHQMAQPCVINHQMAQPCVIYHQMAYLFKNLWWSVWFYFPTTSNMWRSIHISWLRNSTSNWKMPSKSFQGT